MILVVADQAGRVEQIVTLGGSEDLAQIYRGQGKRAAFVAQIPAGSFYMGDGDALLSMPLIEISDFDLKAGQQVSVTVGAQPATVSVFFESNPAGSETISDGHWSIEVDQPGSYTFLFQAAFPYAPTVISKMVTA